MYPFQWFLRYAHLVLVVLLLQGCESSYSAKPIEAWVVDSETKQPQEGVNVVAYWLLEYGIEGGGSTPLKTMETVTDKNGRFYFPAWGPIQIPKNLPSEARLKNNDPELQLFKSGYRVLELRNERNIGSMSGHGASLRTSDWDGKNIQLIRQYGKTEKYRFFLPVFYYVGLGNSCEWKNIPMMIVAVSREKKRFEEQKIPFDGSDFPDIKSLPNQDKCGSAELFFEEYLK